MEEQVKELIKNAKASFWARDYKKAEGLFNQILAATPDLPDIHNMLGLLYHGQGKFDKALESFEKALALNPHYTEASLNLTVTYNDMGRYKDAKTVYGQAKKQNLPAKGKQKTQMDPYTRGKMANRHSELADIYVSMGEYGGAIEEYERALKLAPAYPDIHLKLANAYREQGKRPKAAQILRKVIKENPAFADARVHLGITLFAMGKKAAALAEWKKALELDPENKSAKMYLRLTNARTG